MKSNCVGVGSDRINSHGLKKGPWTAAEDAILLEYVKKHGEGNWNAVQKNSGLMRCGKSCRLRWANHLRPNLKKGSFSPEEERIIIELHAKLGNKWARMAAQLPGRTDNEIKNYWNTRMKRRQRAGLPIYPQQVRDGVAGFLLQQQQPEQEQQTQYQGRKRPSSSLSSNFLSSSLGKKHDSLSSLSLLDSMNFSSTGQNQPISSFYSNLYTSSSNKSGFALPLSHSSPLLSSSSYLYNQDVNAQLSDPSFQFNFGSYEHTLSFSSLLMGAQTEPIDFVLELKAELASSQTPPQPTSTPASSYTSSGGACMVTDSGNTNNDNYYEPKGSSGLLDAVLVESRFLSPYGRNKDGEEFPQVIDKGKAVMDVTNVEEDDGNKYVAENHWDEFSSSNSSIGVKPSDIQSMEERNSLDDDLLSLLNNFPSSMPLPEWYTKTTRMPSGSGMTGGVNMVLDTKQNVSPTAPGPGVTANLDRALGSYCWKNMPGIC
ncbi:hypothetical protein DITRI_Ditri17bG0136000 [Diplodiscus trichospermus]